MIEPSKQLSVDDECLVVVGWNGDECVYLLIFPPVLIQVEADCAGIPSTDGRRCGGATVPDRKRFAEHVRQACPSSTHSCKHHLSTRAIREQLALTITTSMALHPCAHNPNPQTLTLPQRAAEKNNFQIHQHPGVSVLSCEKSPGENACHRFFLCFELVH